jgi:hypothetical protein
MEFHENEMDDERVFLAVESARGQRLSTLSCSISLNRSGKAIHAKPVGE